jgi:RNA polymerase sigma-32 factor
MDAVIHEKLGSFKKGLNERETFILEHRVFSDSPETLQVIGERYGITRERVRQIEANLIKKIRTYFQREIPDFDSFLGDMETD